ncbi:MAG TPA: DUF2760 domain-containing protein [Kiritimatiellia bacterium]|nr:DUF2760 domain-containing protein [Kiritimatiellia bacterium]
MSFGLAFKTFFQVLGNKDFAHVVRSLGETKALPEPEPPRPVRSDALQLLSLLQREGRLVDFLQESISDYSDTQVGAAVRGIHRDCAAALERVFAIQPLNSQPEGSPITVPEGFDSGLTRLTGNIAGSPPYRGTLQHPGWIATRCDLPAWTGSEKAALAIAPAEVEIA